MALSNKVYDQEEGFKDAIGDIVLKTVALKNEIIKLYYNNSLSSKYFRV